MNRYAREIVLFGVFGVSLSAIFGRVCTADGTVTALYRMAFAAILLSPAAFLRCRSELAAAGRRTVLLCVLIGAALGCHFACYLTSLQYTGIASSTVLVDTEVLFVVLASFFLFRERISRRSLLGIALALGGSVLIAVGDRSGGTQSLYGDLLAVGGAVFTAVYTLIGRTARKHLSTTAYTFLVYTAASLTLLCAAAVSGVPLTGYPKTDYLAALGMTLCCTFLGHSIFSWGLRYVSVAFVSTAKLGEPVFATLLGILLFSELPSRDQILGGIAVLCGIFLCLTAERAAQEN